MASFGAKPSLFGPSAASTSSGFGGFGTTTTTSSVGFGTATPAFGTVTGTSTGFGTGTGTTGFGTGTSTSFGTGTGFGTGLGTGTSGFGTGTSLSSGTTGFGTGTGLGTGTTGFGGSTLGGTSTFVTGQSAFGGGLGGGTSTFGTGTTGFGGNTSSSFNFQQTAGNAQQNQAANQLTQMAQAVSLPVVFGDERDALLAKWNQLQAFWGTGKGFFSQNGAVDFTPSNPFCRFKAIGYSCMPKARNEDGLVGLIFAKKINEIQTNQAQVVDSLHKILGGKPNISVCVEGVKSLPDDKTIVTIYTQERSATGTTKRFPATDLLTFLMQNSAKLKQIFVEDAILKTGFSTELLKQYLDNPPEGIDPILWSQAKLDNPDAENLIPVPMIGFSELHKRLKHQDQQTKLHQGRLDLITQQIAELQRNHANMLSRTEQYKRKHLELGHRVLQVMVKQEIYRKLGYAIQADEEQLRVHLEALQAELNAPTQFKGRLNELMSQLRMQNQLTVARQDASYQIDSSLQHEISQHLKQQQEGLQHLISIIKDDLQDLHVMEQGLSADTHQRRA